MKQRPVRKMMPALVAIGVLVPAAIGVVLFVLNAKPVLALYGLDDRETQAVRNLAGNQARITSSAALPAAQARSPHADVIVTHAGLASRVSSLKPLAVPDDILNRTVPSLRRATEIGGKSMAMPIFLDHFELAWNTDRLSSLGLQNIKTMEDLERALASWTVRRQKSTNALEKSTYAFLFAGGDDETLLLLLSALCVSEGGLSAYNAVTRNIAAGQPLETMAGTVIGAYADGRPLTLGSILDRLASWSKKGYLHPEWYALKGKDIKSMIEGNVAFVSAQLLSFHRTVEYNAIARFFSGRFPMTPAYADRALVAPLTVAMVTAGRGAAPRAFELVRALTDVATARAAASTSGRSTTLAAATAPDIQAADALSFAASSPAIISGWYLDAFVDAAAAGKFANQVRERIRK